MEQWKDIKGYEGLYKISSKGLIYSCEKSITKKMYGGGLHSYIRKGRMLKYDTFSGYAKVHLSKNGIKKRYSVHRLVLSAFKKNIYNKECINHIDNNPLNNCIENLEWCTSKENSQHAAKCGRLVNNFPYMCGEMINTSKLNELQVIEILKSTESYASLARKYNVSKTAIRFIKIKMNWKHVSA